MKLNTSILLAIILVCSMSAAAATCESVQDLKTANTTITLAQPVAPGAFTPQGGRGADAFKSLPAFCRVTATITPVPDSEIKIEVWLPESGWNGNLQSV